MESKACFFLSLLRALLPCVRVCVDEAETDCVCGHTLLYRSVGVRVCRRQRRLLGRAVQAAVAQRHRRVPGARCQQLRGPAAQHRHVSQYISQPVAGRLVGPLPACVLQLHGSAERAHWRCRCRASPRRCCCNLCVCVCLPWPRARPRPCRFTKVHTMNAGLWGRQAKIKLTGDHGNWGRVRGGRVCVPLWLPCFLGCSGHEFLRCSCCRRVGRVLACLHCPPADLQRGRGGRGRHACLQRQCEQRTSVVSVCVWWWGGQGIRVGGSEGRARTSAPPPPPPLTHPLPRASRGAGRGQAARHPRL